MIQLVLWPQEDWVEDTDEFVVAGCRVSLRGGFVRVEPLTKTANAQAIADEYVAAFRERVGGLTRVLTVEEFGRLPPRQTTVRRADRRSRAIRRLNQAFIAPVSIERESERVGVSHKLVRHIQNIAFLRLARQPHAGHAKGAAMFVLKDRPPRVLEAVNRVVRHSISPAIHSTERRTSAGSCRA